MDDAELARLEAKMKNPNAWGHDPRYVERLEAEIKYLRATLTRVRGFCEDGQIPAVHGTYADGYRAARRDMLRAIDS